MKKLIITALSAFIALSGPTLASTVNVTFNAHDQVALNLQAYVDLNYNVVFTGSDIFQFDNVTIDWGDTSPPIEDPFPPFGTHYTFAHLYSGEGDFTIVATVLGRFFNGDTCNPGCAASGTYSRRITVTPATAVTPIPAALPLFATALAGLGFAAWHRPLDRGDRSGWTGMNPRRRPHPARSDRPDKRPALHRPGHGVSP